MLSADRKRAFGGWLWAAVLIYLAVRIFDIFYYLGKPHEEAMMMLRFTGVVAPVQMIASLLAALPFATAFLTDIKSGFCVPMTLRGGTDRYLDSKIAATAVSGGLALTLGTLLHMVFLNLHFAPGCTLAAEMTAELPFFAALQNGTARDCMTVYAACLFIECTAGVFWAMVGLVFSAILSSPSLVLCAPPVLYRLFDELSGRILPAWLSPTVLMRAESDLPMAATLGCCALVYGGLSVVCAVLFRVLARRRMRCL